MALRILLHSLSTSAARYRRYIVPTISCGIDFYIRVFVRVHESAAEVTKFKKKKEKGEVFNSYFNVDECWEYYISSYFKY